MTDTTMLLVLGGGIAGCGIGIAVTLAFIRSRHGDGAASVADLVAARLQDEQRAGMMASARMDARLEALGTDLGRLRGLMRQLENGRAEQYGDLARHLEHTMRTTTELTSTTRQLHRVLASSTARGQWGERMADDILRAAGLIEGVNYVRQRRLPSGGIPDVTLFLPQGRCLHMDVKFPIAEYIRHVESTDGTAAAQHRSAFLRDARARVREVAERDYVDAENGVGLVLLLIPNESVFAFLQQHLPQLFEEAMAEGIAVCSPLTLFAILAVVRHTMDSVHLAEASAEIRSQLTRVERRWQSFTRDLERVGTHLRHASGAYDDLAGAGRRAVEAALHAATNVPAGHERTDRGGRPFDDVVPERG